MLEEVLSLNQWKKKKIAMSELRNLGYKIDERKFRKLVEINNYAYGEGIAKYYIAHSNNGYKLTMNWDEIKKSVADKRKRAITMLAECSKCEKQFQRRNNLKMEELI